MIRRAIRQSNLFNRYVNSAFSKDSFFKNYSLYKININNRAVKRIPHNLQLPLSSNIICQLCSRHFSSAELNIKDSDRSQSITATSNSGKIFTELENDTYHKYLENSSNYSETIHKKTNLDEFIVGEDEFLDIINRDCWTEVQADEYFMSFAKAAKYSTTTLQSISDPVFKNLCNYFPDKCCHFTDDQLVKIFTCLQNWPAPPSVRDENFLKVWKALDAEFITRRPKWNYKEILYAIDLWYSLKLTRLSLFVVKALSKLLSRGNKYSQYDLVQIMFYINAIRTVPKGQSLYEVEYQLISKHMRLLTIEEIAIICAGYFKSQNRVTSSELIDCFLISLIKHKDTINSVNLATILKFIRYTCRKDNIDRVKTMLDVYLPLMDRYRFQVHIHFALVCATKRIRHNEVFDSLIKRFLLTPENARLKDMEKIAYLISLFNIQTGVAEKACEVIVSELESERRSSERKVHGKSLYQCLCHLSFNRYFSEKLSSEILDENLLMATKKTKYAIERGYLQLDQNMAMEFPAYKGNRLSLDLVNYLSKRHTPWQPESFKDIQDNSSARFMKYFIKALRALCDDNDNYWCFAQLLPHFGNYDTVVYIDNNKNFLNIPVEIKKHTPFTDCLKPPCTNLGRLVVFVLNNQNHITTENTLIGEQICKLRQLKLLGYHPVSILASDFLSAFNTETAPEYIKEKLNLID